MICLKLDLKIFKNQNQFFYLPDPFCDDWELIRLCRARNLLEFYE